MAAAAGAAAAADVAARRLQAHQLMMEKHFAAPVDVLKPDEHADFGRWRNAIIHRVRQIPGALTHLEDVATVTATAAPPAMGAAPEYDAAQFLQVLLRTFIVKSLSPESLAEKLVRDLLHASGLVAPGGAAQVWQTLLGRYYVFL